MTSLLPTIDIDEFTRAAGLDLNAEQIADLREMLHLHSGSGKWRWPTWLVTNPTQSAELVAARALIGLLVLDENVLWTAPLQLTLRNAFQRLVRNVSQLATPDGPNQFDLDGATIKVRRTNGDERIERLDTGNWLRFACCRYGAARGYAADLLIVDDARKLTDAQRDGLMPTVCSRPNPQIVYA